MLLLRTLSRSSLAAGFAAAVFLLVCGLTPRPVFPADDGSQVPVDSAAVLADSLGRAAGHGPPDSAGTADTLCADSAAGPLPAREEIPEPDSLPPALSVDSVTAPIDTLSGAGIPAPLQEETDTVFSEPQSDNPLALRYNGIYISGATAGIRRKVEEFIDSVRGTVVGGFVIDMKDDHGRLSYTSSLPLAAEIGANTRRLRDPAGLVEELHGHGLIACARVVAFKDPLLAGHAAGDSTWPYAVLDSATGAPWEQDNGELWANPYDERVHDYLLGIIGELISFGFDQIQLDYTRFPTDGKIGHCWYPVTIDSLNRADVMRLFLSKVSRTLEGSRVSLAVDVFGWVPWLHKDRNYWIGQDYDMIAEHADVVCPMLYPSHFPREFKAEYKEKRAYSIVREGTLKGIRRRGSRSTGVQPYIQGFKWRAPSFGSRYILDQMRAAKESGAVGWILWNASNNYAPLWKALKDERDEIEAE
ncbi:MAG: hypothetical protein JXQ83_05160 [Candidatus Glassbacteria bacterium]|nr:hypothetical protein [Candidatus Glassbacteria bacterium]